MSKQPVSPEPPCWHKDIDAQGFCRHCGARAAIQLGNLSLAAQAGAREWLEQYLTEHPNLAASVVGSSYGLVNLFAAALEAYAAQLRTDLERYAKLFDAAKNVDLILDNMREHNSLLCVLDVNHLKQLRRVLQEIAALKAAKETKHGE